MKKKLELAFSLYSPHLLWELALVVQVVVYLACSVTLISNFVQQQGIYRSIQKVFTGECVYFQPYDRLVDLFADPDNSSEVRTELSDKILRYADRIAPNCEIGTALNFIGEADGQLLKAVGYNHVMAERMGIPDLIKQNSDIDETATPVLIRGALCNRYKPGDRFSVNIEEEPDPLTVVVMGNLDENFQMLLPSYGASEPTIDNFFDADIIADDPLENANTIVFCYTGNETWLESLLNPSYFIFPVGEGVSADDLALQDGSVGGQFFSMNELIDNTIRQNIYVNRKPLSKVIAASIFMIISLFGYVFLLFIRNQKLLGVCMLLGMSRKFMYAAIALAVGICVAAAMVLYTLFNRTALSMGIYFATDASLTVMVYSFVLVFASLLAGALACSWFVSQWQPIQYMKGE